MKRFVGVIGIMVGVVYLINSLNIDDDQFMRDSAIDAEKMIVESSVENHKFNTETLKKFADSVNSYNMSEARKTNALRITSAMLIIVSLLLVLKGKARVT